MSKFRVVDFQPPRITLAQGAIEESNLTSFFFEKNIILAETTLHKFYFLSSFIAIFDSLILSSRSLIFSIRATDSSEAF